MTGRRWDASSYDRVGGPMTAMAAAVVERLGLVGDESVLDAGCGTGRVTELLLARLPRGRVLAVDADPDMVRRARENLAAPAGAGRVEVRQADLLRLDLEAPVDAILSTATFHWIPDHEQLFARLIGNLRPGGRLAAQCGGRGNIAELRGAADEVAGEERFAPWFEGWTAPWYYAGPEETAGRLEAAGFAEVRTWLEPWPVVPEDPVEYLATVTLGPQYQRLPEDLRAPFVSRVLDLVGRPVTVGYVRLNIDARRPG